MKTNTTFGTIPATSWGDTAELLTITPDIPSLTLSNEVIIDEENTGDNSYIFGGPYDFEKRIVGTLPKGQAKL